MKKRMIGLLTAVMLLTLSMLTACGSNSSETVKESKGPEVSAKESGVEEKKVLRVGMECAYAPFNWTQSSDTLPNGEKAVPIYGTKDYAYGYDVMVAQMIADKLGWELEIHKVDWSSIVIGMNSGDYDVIIAGMGYTEERDKSVDFTRAYYIRNNVIIMKEDSEWAKATTLAAFDGASATTQIGTIWEKYLSQIPSVKALTNFETTSEVVMAVLNGAADVGVLDEPTALSAKIANPGITYVKLDEKAEGGSGFITPEGASTDVCIAVREGEIELQQKVDACLDGWTKDKMDELMSKAVDLQPLSK